jgi:hypothetical protein
MGKSSSGFLHQRLDLLDPCRGALPASYGCRDPDQEFFVESPVGAKFASQDLEKWVEVRDLCFWSRILLLVALHDEFCRVFKSKRIGKIVT